MQGDFFGRELTQCIEDCDLFRPRSTGGKIKVRSTSQMFRTGRRVRPVRTRVFTVTPEEGPREAREAMP